MVLTVRAIIRCQRSACRLGLVGLGEPRSDAEQNNGHLDRSLGIFALAVEGDMGQSGGGVMSGGWVRESGQLTVSRARGGSCTDRREVSLKTAGWDAQVCVRAWLTVFIQ